MSLFLGACSDDDAPITNAAFGEECTVVSNTSTECTSHVCSDTFDQIGHPVCSQQCTFMMDDPCPAGSTGVKKCNMMGFCRP